MNDTVTVVIGTIGKAHGLKGEVSLILRTDIPEDRLYEGAKLQLDLTGAAAPERVGLSTLTVAGTRTQQGRWYVKFEEVTGRDLADALRGADLTLEVDREEEFEEDPDAWYPAELKGLAVITAAGDVLGEVVDLLHYPAQDQLIVRAKDGRRVMLPFVDELVPEVDLEAGHVIAAPPGGLFDPENAVSERDEQGEG
ncbi:MAG: ribosome maturation factor RimM [Dermabacter sp.]|nr:ribosome maturation factor RimM [Dermabacter sp.]